jgi:glucose/arabinose dehydrogenase
VRTALGVVLASIVLVFPATADSARLVRVAGNFDATAYATRWAGSLYVVEQEGQIWRRRSGTRSLFLDIRDTVRFGGEEGLFSLAFDRDYRSNRYFYVNYTNNNSNIVFARFRANSTFTRGLVRSRKILATVGHPGATNHNGGQIVWGPDGRLYMSTGDGGGGCDPGNNAQDRTSWLGKLFSMNPRNLAAGRRMEGYGLRNPWRFSFDSQTGRLYLADVGQDDWEEVNTRRALGGDAENYGWDVYEGRAASECANNGLNTSGPLVRPISVYSHSVGCSVTGGFVYHGSRLGWLRGWYIFGDYCSGTIWRLLVKDGKLVAGRRLLLGTSLNISSFGQTGSGEIYVVDHGGTVYRLARSS